MGEETKKEEEVQEDEKVLTAEGDQKAPEKKKKKEDAVTDKVAKTEIGKVKKADGVVASALRVLASKTLNQAEMADFADSFPELFPTE